MPREIRTSRVTITQEPCRQGGWQWRLRWGTGGDSEVHEVAAHALQAVRDRDRVLAEAGMSMVTTITWETHNAAGRAIVRALTEVQ